MVRLVDGIRSTPAPTGFHRPAGPLPRLRATGRKCAMPQPRFALLADVDGPISNPDAKAVIDKRIVPALTELLAAGIPVVFNTGRSIDFVQAAILGPLLENGATNLHLLHAVCEKGAVWASVRDDGSISVHVDRTICVPNELRSRVRELIDQRHAATMFYDDTKQTMISVERRPDVDGETYLSARDQFARELEILVKQAGYSVTRTGPERDREAPLQIDPSVIAVDLESTEVGKDLGASRAFQMLAEEKCLPQRWRTIGDSATDYAMAQWLHEHGQSVAHIDVDPDRGHEKHPFPVFRPSSGRDDKAGGAYVTWLSALVRDLTKVPEANFEIF